MQPYIVPIRDLNSFEPFQGIEVGDIGTKLGYNSVDNGYLKFTHYRVPRAALLSRFVSITRDGEFSMNANPRIIYQIMVQTRIAITTGAAFVMHNCAKMAIRYAACRRQFATIKGSTQERALLDYQLHMDTVAKNLCTAITMQLNVGDLASMEAESQREVANGSFKLLDILHHFSAGTKALFTDLCYIGIDELR